MLKQKIALCIVMLLLVSCADLGKGITEAILEKKFVEDKRECKIKGSQFSGVIPHLKNQTGNMKLLMIHGVGNHISGYATEFSEKLAKELNLSVTSKQHKNITLTDANNPDQKLGYLRIHRFLDKQRNNELLFYELTWSEITNPEKSILAYDNSGEYSFHRAKINDMLKKFSNDTAPDPIIYLGESRNAILTAFTQSFCWMISSSWQDLPSSGAHICEVHDKYIKNDEYAFVSHSLGSRITIDGFQKVADSIGNAKPENILQKKSTIAEAFKNKHISLYMMSNQLPMLQLGRQLPKVSAKKPDYCVSTGNYYNDRMLAKTSIIAFSDPNDLLSYALPPSFVDKYLDSRLCADVTNVNINIATVFDVFGLGQVANPLNAHLGYDTDDRVIALIAKGIGNQNTSALIKERCQWIETID